MINDMLDIAKIESGIQEWHIVTTDICALLQDIRVELLLLFATKNQSFSMKVCDDSFICDVDVDRFRQVVVNLLSNAHKFTQECGVIEVETRLLTKEGW